MNGSHAQVPADVRTMVDGWVKGVHLGMLVPTYTVALADLATFDCATAVADAYWALLFQTKAGYNAPIADIMFVRDPTAGFVLRGSGGLSARDLYESSLAIRKILALPDGSPLELAVVQVAQMPIRQTFLPGRMEVFSPTPVPRGSALLEPWGDFVTRCKAWAQAREDQVKRDLEAAQLRERLRDLENGQS